jgi:thiamine-monophosphate kinase
MIEDKNPQRTSIAQLGEFGLIEHLTKNFDVTQESTLKSIGDDAAVLDFKDKKVVVSTDLLVEGVHFDLAYMPLKHLGYKSVVVNVSDICAMNAKPTQITVSVAVSNRFPLEALEELFEGITHAAKEYKVDVIGGDTTSSQKGLIISITAIGEANEDEIVYRNGAKQTDLLVVTGDIGAAYMGLQVLEREKQVFQVNPNNQPDLDPYTYLVERQLKPEARKDVRTLLHICANSQKWGVIYMKTNFRSIHSLFRLAKSLISIAQLLLLMAVKIMNCYLRLTLMILTK